MDIGKHVKYFIIKARDIDYFTYTTFNLCRLDPRCYSCYDKPFPYRCTLPEASPWARVKTSSKETWLKSPFMECFKQEAAEAKSICF